MRGSPKRVATTLVKYQTPAARVAYRHVPARYRNSTS